MMIEKTIHHSQYSIIFRNTSSNFSGLLTINNFLTVFSEGDEPLGAA
jgi:hypothetical protein